MALYDNVVYVGFCDQPLKESNRCLQTSDDSLNKIGGRPVSFNCIDELNIQVACDVCLSAMPLAIQLHCPLYGGAENRCIYLFLCVNSSCQNMQQSWKAFRFQSDDLTNANSKHAPQPGFCTSETKYAWGTDADDWGFEANTTVETIGWEQKDDIRAVGNNDDEQNEEMELEHDFSNKITISDKNPDEHNEITLQDADTMVTSEYSSAVTNNKKLNLIGWNNASITNIGNSVSTSSLSNIQFKEYYIAVCPEEVPSLTQDIHVTTLLRDYEYEHGSVHSFNQPSVPNQHTEVYEKATVSHGDQLFHKFITRLSYNPEQILRYQWNGEPLLSTSLPDDFAPVCRQCGSQCVFELQLTPGLINCLISVESKGFDLEFSTVLIYTCKSSCWRNDMQIVEELAIVQPDAYHSVLK